MDEKAMIEKIVKEIMMSMEDKGAPATLSGAKPKTGHLTTEDYPLVSKRPELVRTLTDKGLEDITLEAVLAGKINPQDIKISASTLENQAQIAESAGRGAFAGNLRRAAEMTRIPDDRILEIYNALRPYRSTKKDLLDIADELETQYSANITGSLVREAAEVYEMRGRLLEG